MKTAAIAPWLLALLVLVGGLAFFAQLSVRADRAVTAAARAEQQRAAASQPPPRS
jgi:hypothetical protein